VAIKIWLRRTQAAKFAAAIVFAILMLSVSTAAVAQPKSNSTNEAAIRAVLEAQARSEERRVGERV